MLMLAVYLQKFKEGEGNGPAWALKNGFNYTDEEAFTNGR